jgi:O-antigen/teichoic acid export membrane protein
VHAAWRRRNRSVEDERSYATNSYTVNDIDAAILSNSRGEPDRAFLISGVSLTQAEAPGEEPTHRASLLRRLHTGVALNFIGSAFGQGSTFALNLVTANLLGRLAFGEFTVVQTTLSTVGALAQIATGYTATKFVAEFRERDPERAARILHLCSRLSSTTAILASVFLALAAPTIAVRAYSAPQLTPWLRTAAPGVLFIVMNGFRSGALAGLESYGAIARVGVVSGIAYITLGVAGAYIGGVQGAVFGVVVSAAIQWLLLGRALKEDLHRWHIPSRVDSPWLERDTLLNFALPASLTGAVTLPAFWLASAFLVSQPGGLEEMAIFGAAHSFRLIVLFVPNVMNNVAMSILNNQRRASTEGFRWVFWWNLGLTVVFVAAGAVAVIALGPWLLRAFGKEFDVGYPVLRILMVAAILESAATWIYQIIQSHGRMWLTLFCVVIPRDFVILVLAYLLTPRYGATGLAAAYVGGWAVALTTISVVSARLGLKAVIVEPEPSAGPAA